MSGHDALALLPTGGGKSICFQVPALAQDGICLVISPLIALMKDQVQNLKRRKIKAAAIFSGMSYREIDRTLDNCIYGQYKFLYLSPERLQTEVFRLRLAKMKVNLIAIDEAHCISQWGYDFRPPYLKIADIRQLLPANVPFLALTATATDRVRQDICQQLQLRKPKVFVKSFARANLSYSVRLEESKETRIADILSKVDGCGIVYVRSRNRTQAIANLLNKRGVKADFYHAGLSPALRSQKQDEWVNNTTRIMVCTNAFGMGIDKPDVRMVIHLEPPDSLEAYYQEAGRAGRDEKRAYAVLLYDNADITHLEELKTLQFPSVEVLRQTYQALANYLQVAVGAGEGQTFPFDLNDFCRTYKLQPILTHKALQILAEEGYIALSDAVFMPSRLLFTANKTQLYGIYTTQPRIEPYIKGILHLYGGGVFDHYIAIDEQELAKTITKHLNYSTNQELVRNALNYLQQQQLAEYSPQNDKPQLTFLLPRADAKKLPINIQLLNFRKKVYSENIASVNNYLTNTQQCRTQQLTAYFAEHNTPPCGSCDVCIAQKKQQQSLSLQENIQAAIKKLLQNRELSIDSIISSLSHLGEREVVEELRFMADRRIIVFENNSKVRWLQ